MFEPFFTTKREGIGLGLFFSKAIVEKHGGTITIGSNPEPPGTTVTFSFPYAGVNRPHEPAFIVEQASVLVVEDNELERQITVDTLREEGFKVEQAALGKNAMEQLVLGRFDVVLTDLMMPGMSGEELLAKVRQTYPATQVVVLTAHGTIDSAVQAMKNGAFYYLTKPTDREALVMTVGKAAELANLKQENQILRTQMEGKLQVEGIIGQDPAIAGDDPDRAQGRAVELDRADPGRERHRQGGNRARDPSVIAAGGAPVRRDQLLGDARQR